MTLTTKITEISSVYKSRTRASSVGDTQHVESAYQESSESNEKNRSGSVDDGTSSCSYTEAEEKKAVRIMDRWILPVMSFSFALQYWDKALLNQSVLFGLSRDLNLIETTGGYDADGNSLTSSIRLSNVSWIFYLGYLFATYPMMVLAHRFPTAKVCGGSIFLWSIVLMSTVACKNYSQLMVNRFFLGVAESCLAPSFTVYVTFWWTRQEQTLRTSLWFGTSLGFAMIFGPLASYGLGHIHGNLGSSWKYIYLIAGLISMVWSLIFVLVLPDDPQRAKWLSPRNRSIILARIKADSSGTVNRHFIAAQFWEALTDFNLYSNAFFHLGESVTNGAISTFSGLVIKGFGFDDFTSVLLLIPMGVVALVSSWATGLLTMKVKRWRYYSMIIFWIPASVGCIIDWLSPRHEKALLYFGLLLLPTIVGPANVVIMQTSANSAGHTKKVTTSAATFIGYCIGNIVGPLSFSSTPGPTYKGGFLTSFSFLIAVILVALFSRWYLGRENARRDREYGPPNNNLGLEDLTDRENKDFRYMI